MDDLKYTISTEFIILEKIGTSGEIKILPRTFQKYSEALKYLSNVNEHLEASGLKFKNRIEHLILSADKITFN